MNRHDDQPTNIENALRIRICEIRSKCPLILPESVHEPWLNGSAGKEILIPFIAEEMTAYPVSMRVNSPRNNDRAIVDPV